MNKKDYILLASVLRSSRPLTGLTVHKRTIRAEQWEADVLAIGVALESDNARFDFNKFLEACGLSKKTS